MVMIASDIFAILTFICSTLISLPGLLLVLDVLPLVHKEQTPGPSMLVATLKDT